MFVNGSFTNARKFFVFHSKICVCFATINKINFININRLVISNNSLNNIICTMPPKRKQSAKEPTKVEKIEEVPSRPKRNRAVTSYNEEYSDEFPVTTATIPITKTKNAGEGQDGNTEVKVKGKRGRKKKVVPEVAVIPEEKVEQEPKTNVEKQDEVDEEPEDAEIKDTKGKEKVEKQNEVDEEEVEDDKEEVEDDKEEEEDDDDDEEVDEEEEEEEVEAKATKGRKKTVEKNPKKNGNEAAKKASAALKNKSTTAYDEINFDDCTRKNENGKEWNFKISNWNVGGIRAWINKGGLDYIKHEKPDVFCLQETKCSEDKLPEEAKVDGYKAYWICSEKDGNAGVGLYTKLEPISVQYGLNDKEHDTEGRLITAEFEKFYVLSVYVPNSGRGLTTLPKRLKWNESFRKFVAELDKKKPVIVCGDMNVSHLEIDLANPKTNTKNAGFTKEERDGMTEFLSDGYVDTFRKIYPDKTQAYTFWTYMANCRAKNIGWRLDYFIVSERFMANICDNIIRNQVFGSDHCPLTLFLNV